MAWTKKIKKTAGKVTTAAKKRYGIGKGRGGFKFTQVAKDLEMIKSRLNVEKNYTEQVYENFTVGASDINNPGWYGVDMGTLISIPQGDGKGQRVGLSCKATGLNVKLNLKGQINASKRRFKIQIVRVNNDRFSPGDLIAEMYDPNPLTGNVDFFSQRKYQDGNQRTFQVLRTHYGTIYPKVDYSTGFADVNLGVKLNDKLRFNSDIDVNPNDTRYMMLIFLDYGNRNPTTPATDLGLLEQGAFTGVFGNWYARLWYVDN